MKPLRPIKIQRSQERLSNRIGLPIIEELVNRLKLREEIDKRFPKPGSNRGIKSSDYIMTLIYMFIDGAIHLEDVNHLHNDEAFQEMLKDMRLPSSDAIGDWLRRVGSKDTEEALWEVSKLLFRVIENPGEILDIDTTIIEADKGDAEWSYKKVRGYQPLIGIMDESGLVVNSDFRQGNVSPQLGLVEFIDKCRKVNPKVKYFRVDSAGWKRELVDYAMDNGLYFTITADQTSSVLEAVRSIPEMSWEKAVDEDGIREGYEVGEVEYYFGSKKRKLRLIVKRKPRFMQMDLFDDYHYWVIGTNLPKEGYSSYEVIKFHQRRGGMEKRIGELKHQINLDHLPCGQFNANILYFTAGLMAYNIIQILKIFALPPEFRNKTIRSVRYQLIKLAGKLVLHARYIILRISAPLRNIKIFERAYLRVRLAPLTFY